MTDVEQIQLYVADRLKGGIGEPARANSYND
jgi:hypothetical protein